MWWSELIVQSFEERVCYREVLLFLFPPCWTRALISVSPAVKSLLFFPSSYLHDIGSTATISPDLSFLLSSAWLVGSACAWLFHTFIIFPIGLRIFSYALPKDVSSVEGLLNDLGYHISPEWNKYISVLDFLCFVNLSLALKYEFRHYLFH